MKTITIYELLGLVKDGKVPKKVRYNDEIYDTESSNNFSLMTYEATGKMSDDGEVRLFLNDEVEILEEEKKIPLKVNKIIPSQNYVISDSKNNSVDERLEIIRKKLYANELYMLDLANTLNEIIDYLKSKGE